MSLVTDTKKTNPFIIHSFTTEPQNSFIRNDCHSPFLSLSLSFTPSLHNRPNIFFSPPVLLIFVDFVSSVKTFLSLSLSLSLSLTLLRQCFYYSSRSVVPENKRIRNKF